MSITCVVFLLHLDYKGFTVMRKFLLDFLTIYCQWCFAYSFCSNVLYNIIHFSCIQKALFFLSYLRNDFFFGSILAFTNMYKPKAIKVKTMEQNRKSNYTKTTYKFKRREKEIHKLNECGKSRMEYG